MLRANVGRQVTEKEGDRVREPDVENLRRTGREKPY